MPFLGPYDPVYLEVEAMLKNLSSMKGEISFISSAVPVGDILPAGSTVIGIIVRIVTPFDQPASLLIGDGVAQSRWVDDTVVDLSQVGLYEITVCEELSASAQVRAYVSSGSSSTGSGAVYVIVREN